MIPPRTVAGTVNHNQRSVLLRWITFNFVGLIGIGVQMFVLVMLHECFGLHYLAATVIAVETAIVHNFVWHERWTWLDRTVHRRAGMLRRMIRFNLAAGVVSIGGNAIFMALLVSGFGLHYVPANLLAIGACSILNFLASDRLVFRIEPQGHTYRKQVNYFRKWEPTQQEARMMPAKNRMRRIAIVTIVCLVSSPATSSTAAELQNHTVAAWVKYIGLTEARIDRELRSPDGFLVQDFQQPAKAAADRALVMAGGVVVAQMNTRDGEGRKIKVPAGMIHHWRGTVFIPNTSLEVILSRVRDPDANEHRQEDVLESRVLARDENSMQIYLKLVRSKIVTVTYNTEHFVQYRTHGPGRASSRSSATKIAELENANTPAENEKPIGSDHGFLWRLNSYWRYEQVEGGVLVECESVSLSRTIPSILKPLVMPLVKSVARESMKRTLDAMRDRFVKGDHQTSNVEGRTSEVVRRRDY
jgi:putative flippase GtrA